MSMNETFQGGKNPMLASDLIGEIAPSLGFTVNIEPEHGRVGQLKTPDGRVFYFRGRGVDQLYSFPLNNLGAAAIAKDKTYAAYFMGIMGYPVPEGRSFYSDRWSTITQSPADRNAALLYAHDLGFPVIVKPNRGSGGIGVQLVDNDLDFTAAVDDVFNEVHDKIALVQRFVPGDDYRFLVLDTEVIAAFRRLPLSVTGDGASSIQGLMRLKQEDFDAQKRGVKIKFDDPRISKKLRRKGLTTENVLSSGETVSLLDNANLSTGGEAIDVLSLLDDSHKEMAVKLVADMGLRLCGVDMISSSPIDESLGKNTIIEINSSPGLDYYVDEKKSRESSVRVLYEKLLKALLKNA